MALPQAVQQQIDQAETLQQQLYGNGETAEVKTDQPVAETPVEEASNVVELSRAEPVKAVETPRADSRENDAEYWKSRFSTMQGKFNAEVPQLYQQVKEQNQRIAELAAQLQARDERPAPTDDALVTSKDEEDYGADLIDMTRRVARETVSKEIAKAMAELRKDVGSVREHVGQVSDQVAQTSAEKFWTGVMNLVPDWKAVDSDPAWIDWLDTTPEFAEDTYRTLAAKAIQRGDAQKIANLVARWRGPNQTQQAPARSPAVQSELQRQVTPSTQRSSTPPPQGGKVWSVEEYKAAMDVRNVQKFGQKEADRLEAEANQAVADGRVRW
jgi:hypothetical protein